MKTINEFLAEDEIFHVRCWIDKQVAPASDMENLHIKEINDQMNGFSILYDISRTSQSTKVSSFQGDESLSSERPEVLKNISSKIADALEISDNHMFAQLISMKTGGKVSKHYDAAVNGFVTYKCNLNVMCGPNGNKLHVDRKSYDVFQNDLYCFEASLYKHWVEPIDHDLILLSFGFLIPYEELGWDEESPRIRMSQRISKYFQSSQN